jgi:hypothetical protein
VKSLLPASIDVQGGNNSNVVPKALVRLSSLFIPLAFGNGFCQVRMRYLDRRYIPPNKRSKSKEQAQTPQPPGPFAGKESESHFASAISQSPYSLGFTKQAAQILV